MKKILVSLLVLTMVVASLTACSKSSEPAKTGLAVITSLGKSKAATADAEGLAQTDSLVVAVLVNKDGKILDCQIDSAQTKVNFTTEGKLTSDVAAILKSKQELGADYGMKSNSAIGKEWNEQADAFAKYVIGKTAAEVKGIAISSEGAAADADLAASVSIRIGDFVAAVEKAVTSAQDLGAAKGDNLGLAVTTDIAKSKDAAADAEGLAQAYSNYAVVTVDKDGKITSCYFDASQGNVKFDTTGVISTDVTVAVETKQELGDAYGMKKASTIGKEWFEQANALADHVKGKTVDEVTGIALTDEGLASDADLAASVSIHLAPFTSNVAKAVANAAK